jgi:SNF2 family DNA or RNA helicase
VVTTYGLIRNDIDMFREVTFRYVVLDESQTVKNPLTKGYRSVMQLRPSTISALAEHL